MNTNYTIEQVVKAAKRYLEFKGWEVLDQTERDGSPYIVADDFGTIAVVKVAARGDGFPNIELDREVFEDVAASYLKDHDTEDAQVRPDLIELWVVNSNRALLRHNIGCVLADCAA